MLMCCPRCDETDERHVGINRCGLCDCEFIVGRKGKITLSSDLMRQMKGGGSDDAGNTRSSFG